MADLTTFKRLNFFTGFFTTAKDWNEGQHYHLEKRKLHNRGLHTPGIIRGQGQELRVEAAGGLNVRVLPGVALDSEGNEIYLATASTLPIASPDTARQLVYISIRYDEKLTDYVENTGAPQYSGHTRWTELPILGVSTTQPDNKASLELARIELQPGVSTIADPADPDNPGNDEIDRRYVIWAGSVGVAEQRLTPELQQGLILLMQDKRRDFAALAGRFPIPSGDDVRHAALTVEMLARVDLLRPEQLPDVLSAIAAIEQDVGQEIGDTYPAVATTPEFQAYQDTVAALLAALRAGMGGATLLTREGEVAETARELSEVVLQPPEAAAGPDRTVTTSGEEATVRLDTTGSRAFGGREILRYRWEKRER